MTEGECGRRAWPRRALRGAASVEYAVVTAAVIVALFVDIPGLGVSALEYALDALRGFQRSSSYHLSLP